MPVRAVHGNSAGSATAHSRKMCRPLRTRELPHREFSAPDSGMPSASRPPCGKMREPCCHGFRTGRNAVFHHHHEVQAQKQARAALEQWQALREAQAKLVNLASTYTGQQTCDGLML